MSVEAPVSGASTGVTISSAVSAEAPSFSNFSSTSLEMQAMTSGISQPGIISEMPSISAFQDGGIISQENPFGIEELSLPQGMEESRVLREASEIAQREFDNPFPKTGVIFSPQISQIISEVNPVSKEPLISEPEDVLFTPAIKQTLEDNFPEAEMVVPDFIESEFSTKIEEMLNENIRMSEIVSNQDMIEIAQMETVADTAQAQKVAGIIQELGLEEELMPQLENVLDEKGIELEEVSIDLETPAVNAEEVDDEVKVDLDLETTLEDEDPDVVKTKLHLENKKNIQEEELDPRFFVVDDDTFIKRQRSLDKAVEYAFTFKKEDRDVTGEDVARHMPDPENTSMRSEIRKLDDPTYGEFIMDDVRDEEKFESQSEARKRVTEINRDHLPVAYKETGISVTEREVRKVLQGRKIDKISR